MYPKGFEDFRKVIFTRETLIDYLYYLRNINTIKELTTLYNHNFDRYQDDTDSYFTYHGKHFNSESKAPTKAKDKPYSGGKIYHE